MSDQKIHRNPKSQIESNKLQNSSASISYLKPENTTTKFENRKNQQNLDQEETDLTQLTKNKNKTKIKTKLQRPKQISP